MQVQQQSPPSFSYKIPPSPPLLSASMRLSLFLSAVLGLTATAIPVTVEKRVAAPAAVLSVKLDTRANFDVVRNELLNGPCKKVTVIFARGTGEDGNVGRLVGPPFFNALTGRIGDMNVAVQGVDYPANLAGYAVGGDPAGASKLASLANTAASKCPNTQIVLSGYR